MGNTAVTRRLPGGTESRLRPGGLLAVIAICCNLLVGYGARHPEAEGILMLILPIVVSISFFLIADIDSPRGGIILVQPQNLVSFAQSLQAH